MATEAEFANLTIEDMWPDMPAANIEEAAVIITEFLQNWREGCFAWPATDFGVSANRDVVLFRPNYEDEEASECFMEVCRTLRPDLPSFASEFMLSILHEIGHTFTDDAGDDDDMEDFFDFLCDLTETEEDNQTLYMNTPKERRATQWAVDEYMHNPETMEKMAKRIKVLLGWR